jgi:hypothetical protein
MNTVRMNAGKALVMSVILLLSVGGQASDLPNAPQPNNEFSSGFGIDNQLYFMQGYSVAIGVGPLTHRSWMGAAAGVGSCMLWRAVHDQGYKNDSLLSSNRVAFCALGSAAGYATDKWLFRIHRNRR